MTTTPLRSTAAPDASIPSTANARMANVIRALAKRDYRIRVAVRRPELAGHLQPLGKVGQINAVQANLRYPASVEAAMRDSHVAINLCGILAESGAQSFDADIKTITSSS